MGYAQKSWEHGCYTFSLYIFSNKEVVSCSPKNISKAKLQDQVSITIKGLRLGATDYLVKPLHTKELSELWMHMKNRCIICVICYHT